MSLVRRHTPTLDGPAISAGGGEVHMHIPAGEFSTPFHVRLVKPGGVREDIQVAALPWQWQGHLESVRIVSALPADGGSSSTPRPLIDMVELATDFRYKGFTAGLYPGGTNAPPQSYVNAGLAAAALIEPLDASGNPSPTGKMGVVGIGMSNAAMEYCQSNFPATPAGTESGANPAACTTGSWIHRWDGDPSANHTTLVPLNGAWPGMIMDDWDEIADPEWDRVRDTILTEGGITEAQVQVIYAKVPRLSPTTALPTTGSRAELERAELRNVIASAKSRYPNLRQFFMSSRTYATHSNHVPHAYENGFAVKWVIEDFINGVFSPGCFVTWGPYMWANGTTPRSDGLIWEPGVDLDADEIHPTPAGISKAGDMMHTFFMESPFTPWYRV